MVPDSDVTVCIPTFNQAAYLDEAVRSALAQTLAPRAVLVQDDASTDDTARVMSALAAADPRVQYRRNEANLGIPANNTRLMQGVTAEFIARLDSDDALEPQYLDVLLPLMRAHPTAGYAHAAVLRVDSSGAPLQEVFLSRRAGFQPPDAALRAAVTGYRVAANIVVYRRAALEQLNFFNGRPRFCEDYDMSAALAAAGWGNIYIDQLLSRYRVWNDAGGVRLRRKHLELQGYIHVFEKTLAPAFAAHGWSPRPLHRQRRHLALAHSNACFLPHNAESRTELVALLRELGGGPSLELKMMLLRAGVAPVLERLYQMEGRLKNAVKRRLARGRASRLLS
jgi:glycosyltransferase involved in cell wall biosynthesis